LDEIASASFDLTRRGGGSQLRLWCVPGFASEWLATRLADFGATHPKIDLELHPTDGSPDFVRYEADADIRYVKDETPGTDAVPGDIQSLLIARPPVIAVASPTCAASFQDARPEQLVQAPLLHESDFSQWRRWFAGQSIEDPGLLSGPKLWHAHLTLNAARQGQGIALTNALLVGDDLRSGRLVRLLPDSPTVLLGAYYLRCRRDKWQTPAIIAFRRWLQKNVATSLALSSGACAQ
jgi:DNA-binding transcriptional LysR family regulator